MTRFAGRVPASVVAPMPPEALNPGLEKLIEALHTHATALERISEILPPDALYGGSVLLDTNGNAERNWHVPYKSAWVHNTALFGNLTVAAQPLANAAPGPGPGVAVVPSGSAVVLPISGRSISFYGPAGATVNFAVYTGVTQPDYADNSESEITKQVFESATPLGGGATFNGAAFDAGNNAGLAGQGWSRFRVFSNQDQVGTLAVQQSRDGVTWFTTTSVATAANTPAVLESILVLRFARLHYVNGGVAQGTFEADSCAVAV